MDKHHRTKWVSRFRDTAGTVAIMFAIMAPVLVSSAGVALDFAESHLIQQRLSQAIDAAALAAAASSRDEAVIRSKVQQFFDMNYPDNKLGVTFTPEVTITGGDVTVSGHATYNTQFMTLIGLSTVTVSASATVTREVQGLEVVMVLDNTGSMSTNNNIGTLKTAARNFVNILYSNTSTPSAVKVGLVPFANSVRVGRYGLGLNPDGTTYGDGTPFVSLPTGVTYTTSHSGTGWYGCVIEHNATGWNAGINTNDPYPQDVTDDYPGLWDAYQYGSYRTTCSGSGSRRTCTTSWSASSPNDGCPYANVLPLTSDQNALLTAIGDPASSTSGMRAHGNTLSNVGMMWGYRMISPEAPFTEGHNWDDPYWRKAVILMTDGMNTRNGNYSYFWRSNNNQLSTSDFNDRLEEVCTKLKDNGVTIYTVTFYSEVDPVTKEYYRRCATSDAHYYDAPSQEDLVATFEAISEELSNLHIKE